jgi:hypothetical protein
VVQQFEAGYTNGETIDSPGITVVFNAMISGLTTRGQGFSDNLATIALIR